MNWLKRLSEWMLPKGKVSGGSCWPFGRQRFPAVPVGIGLALALPSLWGGLQTDDLMIRAAILRSGPGGGISKGPWQPFTFLDGDPARTLKLMDLGWMPWWTDPACRLAFLRPVTALTHIADHRLWPNCPALMHVQSLAWFGLLVWAAAALYRRLLGPAAPAWGAALAALLFAVTDGHAWPAGWLANRNSLLAGLFGCLALIAYDRWRRDGWRAGAALAPLALAAGLLAKEEAVSVGAYLLAYALFLDRGPWRRRLAALAPCAAVGLAWLAAYRMLGFGVARSGGYLDPLRDAAAFAGQVGRDAPLLLLGQWGFPASELSLFLSASAFWFHWAWAVAFLVVAGAVLAPLIARDGTARFWAAGMVLSVVPVCATFPHDRLLMFAGLGAMGLLAQFLCAFGVHAFRRERGPCRRRDFALKGETPNRCGLKEGAAWLPASPRWRRLAGALGAVFIAVHLVASPVALPFKAISTKIMGGVIDRLFDTLPSDPAVESQAIVYANSISSLSAALSGQSRSYRGLRVPARSLALNASCSPASLTRLDARTLVVRPRGGYLVPCGEAPGGGTAPPLSLAYFLRFFDRIARSPRHPLALGETVELTTASVQVTALTEDGRPAEATFRFRVPLEAPSLRWLAVSGGRYVPFTPPAIGATVEVPSPLE